MAVFERDRLPSRSALSRFLAALTPEPVEALRTLFLKDLLERRANFEQQPCGLSDRTGNRWVVFDIDGTREAARQRALPKGPQLPLPHRRLDALCAPGYPGRKRGEVVRTRTTVMPRPFLPVARLVWPSRQRRAPQGIAPSSGGDPVLSASAPVGRSVRTAAA
jgi:hypothetical protein